MADGGQRSQASERSFGAGERSAALTGRALATAARWVFAPRLPGARGAGRSLPPRGRWWCQRALRPAPLG